MPRTEPLTPLNPLLYEDTVRCALQEDFGRVGDITTGSVVPEEVQAEGRIVARRNGCIAGIQIAVSAFRLLDPSVEVEVLVRDGEAVNSGDLIAAIRGSARTLLEGERTALNFLGHLSGIASVTRSIVNQIEGTTTRIVCTRKTTPGLRVLEKYAVRAGGGHNHRFGLDDGILIKENHISVAGGVTEAIRRARARAGHLVKIEVEVESLEQLEQALREDIDAVLLDNMSVEQIREAVARVAGRAVVEASGGITPERVPELASTGVDIISLGWLTHSAPNLDVAFDVLPVAK